MFSRKETLSRHLIGHINPTARPFKCQHCEKSFRHSCNLREHLKTHTLIKPHECDQCTRKFYDKSKLKEHKQIHDDTDKFECLRCNMKFSTVLYKLGLNFKIS